VSDAPAPALAAKSPFELRVHLGDGVNDQTVRDALASGDMGFLHSYTTGSTVDGPGVRVVAWTTGCMWRCQYCHNPDTWTLTNGLPVSVAKAAEELGKYRQGLITMKGGFTLSGGDPLMQHRFSVKLLAAAKKMGIHTTIETNGFYGERLSDAEVDTIDLVMLGIKTFDAARHLALTGHDNRPTLAFARRLAERKRPMWIRFVLVPGLTDDLTDLARTAEFAAGLGTVERVEVLPFHQMGRYKWERLGLDYRLKDVAPPTAELAERACEVFRQAGLQAN
jgi:pyruvate formate lyase activating enzyme